MGYRIEYQSVQLKQHPIRRYIRLPALVGICFLIFLFIVEIIWQEGAAILEKTMLPIGESIAVSALNDFANKLETEDSFLIAVTEFCRNLVS